MFRTIQRCFYSNIRNFTSLQQMNAFLLKNKFAHSLIYFRSGWNPQCDIADQQLTKLASQNRFLEVVRIDSDVSPKIAKHYGIKYEPQFVFCLYGDQIIRQIGPNYNGLKQKLDKMVKLGETTDTEYLSIQQKWVPYGTFFERYYTQQLSQLYKRNVSDI